MAILSLDTCLQACSAAILCDGDVLACHSEPLAKGHAERLAPLVQTVLSEAQLTVRDIARIAVTIGPGSFTGVRVGLAFARGLAVTRPLPVTGFTSLEVLAASVSVHKEAVRGAVIDARRGQVYGQLFDGDALDPLTDPFVLEPEQARKRLEIEAGGRDLVLTGTGVPLTFPEQAEDFDWASHQPDPVTLARLALTRTPSGTPPEALYLRAPDAKPARPIL